MLSKAVFRCASIRVFAKNMGDPYYELIIMVHDCAFYRYMCITYMQSSSLGCILKKAKKKNGFFSSKIAF